jgi:hypothetical protein
VGEVKIQIGRASSPAPIVKLVTMISSKESAKASSPAGDEGGPDGRLGIRVVKHVMANHASARTSRNCP